jgi:hypothetical protein
MTSVSPSYAPQAAEKVFLAREMAKSGGSEMYPEGSAIAYSASNRVDDFALGIDRDFFRSLSSLQKGTLCGAVPGYGGTPTGLV